jgi:hypothetical protein
VGSQHGRTMTLGTETALLNRQTGPWWPSFFAHDNTMSRETETAPPVVPVYPSLWSGMFHGMIQVGQVEVVPVPVPDVLGPLFGGDLDIPSSEVAPAPSIPHLDRWTPGGLVADRALDLEAQGAVAPGELARNVGSMGGQIVGQTGSLQE